MKTAIVVGGTAGVGRGVVERLLEHGYQVGVIARGQARLKALAASHGDAVRVESADCADAAALDRAVDALVQELDTPDLWINNAMATSFSPFSKMSAEEFERVVDVTFLGQVNGTRAALRHMKSGKIICVGSGLGYRSVPLQSAYCAAKHAINGFVSSVRSELIRDKSNVSIHLVQLPAINTPQFDWARHRFSKAPQPAPPIFSPKVAVDAVMKTADTGSREVLVGRSVLPLIFGNFVLPDYLDKKMAESGDDAQKSDAEDTPQDGNLFEPVEREGTAEGSYSDRASDTGLIVDGDLARKVIFGGGLLATFVLGLIIG